MTILITGYSGFLGQRLVPRLLAEGHAVICAGRRPPHGEFAARCRYHACDLGEGVGLAQLPWPEVEAVVHLASAGVKASHRFWPECLAVNIVGLQHLLTAMARFAKVKKLVVTGTFYEMLLETNPILWENPYVATKWTAAQNLQLWANDFGVTTSLVHLFQVYGSEESQDSVLSYIKNALLAGKVARLGSGRSRRDWLYLDDAIDALCHALKLSQTASFSAYDVGSGELHSIREAAELLADRMERPHDLLDFDWKRDRHDTGIELAAAKVLPGWSPRFGFAGGLERFARR